MRLTNSLLGIPTSRHTGDVVGLYLTDNVSVNSPLPAAAHKQQNTPHMGGWELHGWIPGVYTELKTLFLSGVIYTVEMRV